MMPTRFPDDEEDDQHEYYTVEVPEFPEHAGEFEEKLNPEGGAHPIDTIQKDGTTVGVIMHRPNIPSMEEQVERMQEIREQMEEQFGGGGTDTDDFRYDP